jgi:flagellar biosynthesis/type III secretory pathway protein FliH
MKEAVSCVKYMSFGEQLRWEMLKRQVRKMDERAEKRQIQRNLEEARAKGLLEGMERGMEIGFNEGTLKIAYKMKRAKRPFSEIAEFTGIPPDDIQYL